MTKTESYIIGGEPEPDGRHRIEADAKQPWMFTADQPMGAPDRREIHGFTRGEHGGVMRGEPVHQRIGFAHVRLTETPSRTGHVGPCGDRVDREGATERGRFLSEGRSGDGEQRQEQQERQG